MTAHFSWQAAVCRSDIPSTTKLVLLVIGTHMNMHGEGAFPSYSRIGEHASLNRATVIRHVEAAVLAGWLEKSSRLRKNRQTGQIEADSNGYEIAFPSSYQVVAQDNHPQSQKTTTPVAQDDHPSRTERPPQSRRTTTLVAQGDPNTPITTPITTPSNTTPKAPSAKGDGFDAFWSVYPKKIGKGGARKAWAKAIKAAESVEAIMASLRQHLRCIDWLRDDGQYIPHATTWLNQCRWEDEPIIASGARDRSGKLIPVDSATRNLDGTDYGQGEMPEWMGDD